MPIRNFSALETSQGGYVSVANPTYTAQGDSIGFATDQSIWYRMFHQLVPGATINSATLYINYSVKDGNTTQSSLHTVGLENSVNATPLESGESASNRTWLGGTNSTVNFTLSWTAGESGVKQAAIDVTQMFQNLVNTSGFVAGGAFTVFIKCTNENGSDMNIKMPGGFSEASYVSVNYTHPSPGPKYDFNLLRQSSFALNSDTWGTNDYFGGFATDGAVVARDATFGRTTTLTTSLKFTTPTPDGTKASGPLSYVEAREGDSMIFSGWLYIPSTVTAQVDALFYFADVTAVTITARNQWVPFCTIPFDFPSGFGRARWPTIRINSGYTAGQNIWLSTPAVILSNHRQMPFWAGDSDTATIDHYPGESTNFGQSVRKWTPKTRVNSGSGLVPVSNWRLNEHSIWQLAER